jgi:UDP-N-acetylmuramoyl-tripeptide--D-alanyl-D-alanine ligase
MHGELISGDGTAFWSGISLDSRRVRGGELFFAFSGEQTDGHRFVGAALEAGAVAAVVENPDAVGEAAPLIAVDDTFRALHRLTREIRSQVPQRLVGITGSSGKTTTKELLAKMLARTYRAASSPGNLNNLFGFPVALMSIPDDTEWMVAEMGMSTPGELKGVSLLGQPDVAVFTNVREAHLEAFGTLEAIAEAKAELLAGLAADGIVIANADDPQVVRIANRHSGRIVWYGRGDADVTVRDVGPRSSGAVGTAFRLCVAGDEVAVELPLHGLYNVDNFLAAAACAWALEVPLAEIAAAVGAIEPSPMRGVVHQLADEVVIIDDAYNSNPDALGRALESAAALPATRHWAVLGEMLELGPRAGELHAAAGEAVGRHGFSPVFGVGDAARELIRAAGSAGAETRWYATAAEAAGEVAAELRRGDVVLVKGSRGVGLEAVVEALLGRED